MQPTAVLDTVVESNIEPTESIHMEIDAAATAHLMSVLTNLYSDPELAVIREYSTNAWDSHVAAGKSDLPIRITMPSALNPYFRVQDFGLGMDLDDIRNTYSKYGASTKREDSTQNGMLGLGSKSALTYSSQFSITAVKSGVEHTVSVSVDETGVGVMDVISSRPTTEPNGVTIEVPVKRNNEFGRKISEFFRFWKPGTVLVNGQQPKSILDSAVEVVPNLYQVGGLREDYVVFSNVAYPVSTEYAFWQQGQWNRQFGVVLFAEVLPSGEPPINHTPNREALFYSKRTIAALEVARESYKANMKKAVQKEIDACDTHHKAFTLASDWNNRYHGVTFDGLTYKGLVIPSEIRTNFTWKPMLDRLGQPVKDSTGKPQMLKEYETWYTYDTEGGAYSLSDLGDSIVSLTNRRFRNLPNRIIVDYPFKGKPSATIRAKIRQYADKHGWDGETVGIFATKPDMTWLDHMKVIPFDDIKSVKLPSRGGKSKPSGKFQVLNENGRFIEQEVDFSTGKYLYVSMTDVKDAAGYHARRSSLGYDHGRWADIYEVVEAAGYKVIILAKNRWDKFEKEHSNISPLDKSAYAIVNAYESSLTFDERLVLEADWHSHSIVEGLINHGLDVDDPDVVALVKARRNVKDHQAVSKKHRRVVAFAQEARIWMKIREGKKNFFVNYPLANSSHTKHTAIYINSVYNGN